MTTIFSIDTALWICAVCDSANDESDMRCQTCAPSPDSCSEDAGDWLHDNLCDRWELEIEREDPLSLKDHLEIALESYYLGIPDADDALVLAIIAIWDAA